MLADYVRYILLFALLMLLSTPFLIVATRKTGKTLKVAMVTGLVAGILQGLTGAFLLAVSMNPPPLWGYGYFPSQVFGVAHILLGVIGIGCSRMAYRHPVIAAVLLMTVGIGSLSSFLAFMYHSPLIFALFFATGMLCLAGRKTKLQD